MSTPTAKKRGPLSPEEREFILAAIKDGKSADTIARHINRNIETVVTWIANNVTPDRNSASTADEVKHVEQVLIRQELKNSEAWKNLREEFTVGEIRYFEESYVKMMSQLRDVLASEETQVFQAIKFEILMSRNLRERKKCLDDIERFESMKQGFISRFPDPLLMTDGEREQLLNVETQLNTSRNGEQSRTNEFVKLQERHDSLMKSLKSTRDQRIKEIEKQGENLIGVIKNLCKRDVQEREGRQMELLKLAGKNAHMQLGRPITYDDGSMDNPILCADTVDLDPAEKSDDREEKEEAGSSD